MDALTPASPDSLPPLGAQIADEPFWRYRAGRAGEGIAHLRVWTAKERTARARGYAITLSECNNDISALTSKHRPGYERIVAAACSDLCRVRQLRAERVIEDAGCAAGVIRLVRAQSGRAGADLVMFALFAESVDYARDRLQDAADQLIVQGYSYGDIGRVLGITRQGARQRFRRQQEAVTRPGGTGRAG